MDDQEATAADSTAAYRLYQDTLSMYKEKEGERKRKKEGKRKKEERKGLTFFSNSQPKEKRPHRSPV